jgi:hypothetical protein
LQVCEVAGPRRLSPAEALDKEPSRCATPDARTRAVEPAHVDATPSTQFLPATVTAATARGISIATSFAVNNAAVFREAP